MNGAKWTAQEAAEGGLLYLLTLGSSRPPCDIFFVFAKGLEGGTPGPVSSKQREIRRDGVSGQFPW